ncbi:IclR family transcriptional regulator [Microbaculum marinum]|uniref:IclR family transcriptional regulator n=1 Tax=Microbaculum marinum TaxID=1764581 RepID=A0AAW9REV0_9HYPH
MNIITMLCSIYHECRAAPLSSGRRQSFRFLREHRKRMPKVTQKDNSTEGVQAVVVALKILEILSFGGKAGRITDLAEELGTTKNRIYRHLATLGNLGYVVRDPDTERYKVGIRLVQLGSAVANQYDLLSVSRPAMRRVRDSLGNTVVLSKVDADQIYAIERIDGSTGVTVGVVIGSPLGLHSSAQGKIVLAFGQPGLLEAAIGAGLEPRTSRTIVDPDHLRREVATVRDNGWAVAPDETMTGINGIAVPILDPSGDLIATLAVLGSVDELPSRPSERQIEVLKSAAAEISANLHSQSAQGLAPVARPWAG